MSVLALCGKGGTGKTTLSALLCRSLLGASEKVLVVDGDPSGGLCMALDLRPSLSLDELRRELIRDATTTPDPAQLLATADYRLMEALVERENLALLSVGRPEEAGCYCRLNDFLRQAMEALAQKFDLVIVDAEAGIEQINRRVMRSVTHLLLVCDPSRKSHEVALAIHEVARSRGDGTPLRVGRVVNRSRGQAASPGGQAESAGSEGSLPVVLVPEDEAVRTFDAQARSFFEIPDASGALAVVRQEILGRFFG